MKAKLQEKIPVVGQMYNKGVCYEVDKEFSYFYTKTGRVVCCNPISDLIHLNSEKDQVTTKALIDFYKLN